MIDALDWDSIPAFMNVGLLAKFLGIGKASAYSLMHIKGFPVIQIGRRYVIPKEGLRNWVQIQSLSN